MNQKGFTLTELLGVIVILSLLMVFAFPKILNSIKGTGDKVDNYSIDLVSNATKLYIDDNSDLFEEQNGSTYYVSLVTLVNEGYLKRPVKILSKDQDITDSMSVKVLYNNGFSYELVNNSDIVTLCENVSNTNGNLELGDEVKCKLTDDESNIETFNVLEIQDNEVVLLLNRIVVYDVPWSYGDYDYPDIALEETLNTLSFWTKISQTQIFFPSKNQLENNVNASWLCIADKSYITSTSRDLSDFYYASCYQNKFSFGTDAKVFDLCGARPTLTIKKIDIK